MDNMSALSNSFDNEHFGPGQGLAPSNSQFGEHAPAYRALLSRNLLVTKYRKDTFEDLFIEGDLEPNSSHAENFQKRWKWGVYWTPGCGLVVYVSMRLDSLNKKAICAFSRIYLVSHSLTIHSSLFVL
jgi:hypothetical protein